MQVLEQRLAGTFAGASRAALSAYLGRLAASVGPPPQLPAAAQAALHSGTRMPQAAVAGSHAAGSTACGDGKQPESKETPPDIRSPEPGTQPCSHGVRAGEQTRAVAVTLAVERLTGCVRVTLVPVGSGSVAGAARQLGADSAGACATSQQSCMSAGAAALPHVTSPLIPGAADAAVRRAQPGLQCSHLPASTPSAVRPAACSQGGRPVAASARQPVPKAELMDMLEDGLGPDAPHAQVPRWQPVLPPAGSPCRPGPAARAAPASPQLLTANQLPTQRTPGAQIAPPPAVSGAHAPPCQKLLLPVRGAGPPPRVRGAAHQALGFLIGRQRQPTLQHAATGLLRPPPPGRRGAGSPAAAAALGKGSVAQLELHTQLAASSATAVKPSAEPAQQLGCALAECAAPCMRRAALLPGSLGFSALRAVPAGVRMDAMPAPLARASISSMHAVGTSSGASSGEQAARTSTTEQALVHDAGKSCVAGSACPATPDLIVLRAAAAASVQVQRGHWEAPGSLPGAALRVQLHSMQPEAKERESVAAAGTAASGAAFAALHAAGQSAAGEKDSGTATACAEAPQGSGASPVLPAQAPGQCQPEATVHTSGVARAAHESAPSGPAVSSNAVEATCSPATSPASLAAAISAATCQPAGAVAVAAAASAAAGAVRTAAGPFPWPTYFIGTRDSFTHRLVPRRSQVMVLQAHIKKCMEAVLLFWWAYALVVTYTFMAVSAAGDGRGALVCQDGLLLPRWRCP